MGSLRLKFGIWHNQWFPTFYELQGVGDDPSENTYTYNPARILSDIKYWDNITMYCNRKIDFSGMANNEVKNVKGSGGGMIKITNHKDSHTNISMYSNALQCITWSQHHLVTLHQHYNNQFEKVKLPSYMIASDLAQLKENVLFNVLWGDNKSDPSPQYMSTHGLTNKFLDITFNLFVAE
jgi:hypothetical protein